MYWKIDNSLKRNCMFNFIIGARGTGKTYGCKEYVINHFLKTGRKFIYLRRYKEEIKKVNKFFDDVSSNPEFEGIKFEVKSRLFLINDRPAGHAAVLSTSKIEKSVPYPDVDFIIFDEFIIDTGVYHYLSDEVVNFLEYYETVARMRNVTVFFLSNAITISNPYFMYFDITLPYGSNISVKNDKLIEMVIDDEFTEAKKQTRFAKLIEGTNYYDYAIENKMLRDNDNFLGKKTAKSRCSFGLRYKGLTYGVWVDYDAGFYFMSYDFDPSCKVIYCITLDDHSPNLMLLKGHKSVLVEHFLKCYKLGLVRFESIKIKNICYSIIKLML